MVKFPDLTANSNLLKEQYSENVSCAYEMNRDLVLIYLFPLRLYIYTNKHKLFIGIARQEATMYLSHSLIFLQQNFIRRSYECVRHCLYRLRAINSNKMQYKWNSGQTNTDHIKISCILCLVLMCNGTIYIYINSQVCHSNDIWRKLSYINCIKTLMAMRQLSNFQSNTKRMRRLSCQIFLACGLDCGTWFCITNIQNILVQI